MLELLKHKANGVMLFAAIPLIVMSYHVFQFFEHDPFAVRLGLAVSFDVLIIVLFVLINDDYIKKNKSAIRACWTCIAALIAFQLYVNTWVYWGEVHPLRAIVSGSIFPLLVAPIAYISSLRAVEQEKREQQRQKRQERKEKPVVAAIANGQQVEHTGWKDINVPKDTVLKAASNGETIDQFRGARNWKSVKRWFNKEALK